MGRLNYERTWCDYLTLCPYFNVEEDSNGLMVGDYYCSEYPFNKGIFDTFIKCDALS